MACSEENCKSIQFGRRGRKTAEKLWIHKLFAYNDFHEKLGEFVNFPTNQSAQIQVVKCGRSPTVQVTFGCGTLQQTRNLEE